MMTNHFSAPFLLLFGPSVVIPRSRWAKRADFCASAEIPARKSCFARTVTGAKMLNAFEMRLRSHTILQGVVTIWSLVLSNLFCETAEVQRVFGRDLRAGDSNGCKT